MRPPRPMMVTVEPDESNKYIPATSRADIKRAAMEQYVFALARGLTENGKRVRQRPGVDVEIRAVELVGEYPDTVLEVLVYLPHRDSEQWQRYAIWKIPDDWYYVDDPSGGRQIDKPDKLVGDILMWARGR
jgi:hypothetical protein